MADIYVDIDTGVKCETCSTVFEPRPRKANRFCGHNCYWQSLKGKPAINQDGLKLGHGWNKGITGEDSHSFGNDWGFQAKGDTLSKTDKNKYINIHKQWAKIAGKAEQCSLCGSYENTQWHSINNRYTLERKDWLEVCAKCHWKIDDRKAGR